MIYLRPTLIVHTNHIMRTYIQSSHLLDGGAYIRGVNDISGGGEYRARRTDRQIIQNSRVSFLLRHL